MACRCLVIHELEEGREEVNCDDRVFARRCRSESIFPMYAMGKSKSNSLSRTILDNAGDPIWDSVRADARLEAEKEQILSSFLYASVLSHDCFERALGFVLANRLQNATLLATQLMDIFYEVMMNDRSIQCSIRLDAQAFKDRDPACSSYAWALLYLKGYHSLQSYRIAHALWNQGRKILALALQSQISEVFAVDIHPAAKIGEGVLLDHGTGLVIGETAVVGNYVSLMQGVTLGGTGKQVGDRHPKIGQGALIGASATVLGNIMVGEGALIAAGSLVLKDVPPHSMAVGNPAKNVGFIQEEEPSLTMKHDAGKDYFEHVAVGSSDGLSNVEIECPLSGAKWCITCFSKGTTSDWDRTWVPLDGNAELNRLLWMDQYCNRQFFDQAHLRHYYGICALPKLQDKLGVVLRSAVVNSKQQQKTKLPSSQGSQQWKQ